MNGVMTRPGQRFKRVLPRKYQPSGAPLL